MSRPGPCSPGPKPSVHSSRPRPGAIVVGLAAAGTSTRSSSSVAASSGTSTAPSMSTARWSTVLLRERRDLGSAQAFFRRARATTETQPAAIVTDHHQPYVRAARQNLPGSLHIRTGLHRLTGETTKPIERSHIATRDRLRASRGLKTTATGLRFLEGFEAVQALRRGDVALRCLVPGSHPCWPLAATVRAPSPRPWSPWQQG